MAPPSPPSSALARRLGANPKFPILVQLQHLDAAFAPFPHLGHLVHSPRSTASNRPLPGRDESKKADASKLGITAWAPRCLVRRSPICACRTHFPLVELPAPPMFPCSHVSHGPCLAVSNHVLRIHTVWSSVQLSFDTRLERLFAHLLLSVCFLSIDFFIYSLLLPRLGPKNLNKPRVTDCQTEITSSASATHSQSSHP